jgi:DNA-binding response OmpR family regulator
LNLFYITGYVLEFKWKELQGNDMKTVLVADDEPTVTDLLARQLSRAGFQAETVRDGQAAMEFVEKNHPDLIILDIFMPRMSGAEVLVNLRDHTETRDMPVIVLSGLPFTCKGNGGSEDRYAPDYSMCKPWNSRELISTVRRLLDENGAAKKSA